MNSVPKYIVSTNHFPNPLHPQTQLAGRSARRDPVQRRMELGDRGHGRDAFTAQLRQLLALGRVDVDEAVHVADAEALDAVAGELLPLGAESVCVSTAGVQRGGRP